MAFASRPRSLFSLQFKMKLNSHLVFFVTPSVNLLVFLVGSANNHFACSQGLSSAKFKQFLLVGWVVRHYQDFVWSRSSSTLTTRYWRKKCKWNLAPRFARAKCRATLLDLLSSSINRPRLIYQYSYHGSSFHWSLTMQSKFWKFGTGDKCYGNLSRKIPENPEIGAFPISEPFNWKFSHFGRKVKRSGNSR